jgi:aerobic-type carbon monoxide dehydrogenase small subunit (CoxS/CutS family)
MSDIKWDIAERINKCGYDMFTALEMAHNLIQEFKSSGKISAQYGIMGAFGKCADVIEIRKVVKSNAQEKQTCAETGNPGSP